MLHCGKWCPGRGGGNHTSRNPPHTPAVAEVGYAPTEVVVVVVELSSSDSSSLGSEQLRELPGEGQRSRESKQIHCKWTFT